MKKKILFCLFALLVFVACGRTKQPEIYSMPEKDARLCIAEFENRQEELDKIHKDVETWRKLASEGNEIAVKELKEWDMILLLHQDKEYSAQNYPSVVHNFPHLMKK